jgi:glycosyltransferase involved in cell wall biosynthesis
MAVARAVQHLVSDPESMASMGAAARERALVEFSPQRMLAEHTAAYEKAIASRR